MRCPGHFANQYKEIFGAKVSPPHNEIQHGVTIVFVELPNTKIELLHPLGSSSPITRFLEKNNLGGIHHICYEVSDINVARKSLEAKGARIIGDGLVKVGAHGNPVLFLHPKDFNGTLIELEQVSAGGMG